jgi:hypothetical protein
VREGTGKQWGSHSLFIRLKRFLNSVLSGFFCFVFVFVCIEITSHIGSDDLYM